MGRLLCEGVLGINSGPAPKLLLSRQMRKAEIASPPPKTILPTKQGLLIEKDECWVRNKGVKHASHLAPRPKWSCQSHSYVKSQLHSCETQVPPGLAPGLAPKHLGAHPALGSQGLEAF